MERKKKNILELTRCSVADYREIPKIGLRVMADNVRSMHNIGSLFRTSDAFKVDEVILGGISGTPPHTEISKTALGAEDSVAWRHVDSSIDEARRLKGEGWKICCLEQTHNSVPLCDFIPEMGERYLLIVGNEVHGVQQELVDMCDTVLEIPQEGTKHSLNVAASAAIAIWHFYIALR